MDLDWTLIEYRPGRYAKVCTDGTFLGTATEAEIRAWFAASTRPKGQEAAPLGLDSTAARPSSLEPRVLAPEPGKVAPEPDEDWEKPLIWAPPRPAREGQAPRPSARTLDPLAAEPASEPPGREVKSSQPEAEVAWAKPMIWGRPPATPRCSPGAAEPPSLTAEAEAATPGAEPSRAKKPAPGPTSLQVDQDKAAPEGPAPEIAGGPRVEPGAGEKAVAADAVTLEPAFATMPASGAEEAGGAEPEAVQVQMGFALREPARPAARDPAPVQVAMDLAILEPIAADSPEPEPGPDEAEPQASGPKPAGPDAEETATEAEDRDEALEIVTVEPDLPEPEPELAQEALAAPLPIQGENDLSVITSAAKHRHESSQWQSPRTREKLTAERKGGLLRRSASRNDIGHSLVKEGLPPDPLGAEEDWLEEEIPEDEAGAASLRAQEDEFELERVVLGPPPTLAPGSVSAGAGLATDEPGPQAEDLDLEAPNAGDLWLWVDPRYEAGYSPATFDLMAFLQRAAALFQSKAWTRGKVPGKIAVHSDDAGQGLEVVAERLGLVVVEDARVSNGTYWLGLGAD